MVWNYGFLVSGLLQGRGGEGGCVLYRAVTHGRQHMQVLDM